MNGFIETKEKIRHIGGTSMIYVGEEAKTLGLNDGDEIGAVLFRPEDLGYVKGLLYGTGDWLFFVSVGIEDGVPFYEVRKSLSERTLAQSLDYKPVTILGPFGTLPECRRFRDLLEEKQETDPSALKELFREFTN